MPQRSPPALPPEQLDPLPTPWEEFVRCYSPHGELPKSSLTSCLVHALLVVIIGLLTTVVAKPDLLPPGVDVVRVSDAPSAAPDVGDGLPTGGDTLEQNAPSEATTEVPVLPQATEAMPVEATVAEVVTEQGKQVVGSAMSEADKAAAAAKQAQSALDDAKKRLAKNLGGGTGGGGGSGATGRAARQARWIMHFRAASGDDYLAQLAGLGAEIAAPDRDGKFRFFSKLNSRPPASQVRDLANESRMYWSPMSTTTTDAVARILGVSSGSEMIYFLPRELEDRMFKLELSYRNAREEDILTTEFDVVARGGKYDVIVSNQRLR